LASPFVTTFREMLEMRYLWGEPLRMDNSRLVAFLGQEPHTPLDDAVLGPLSKFSPLIGSPKRALPPPPPPLTPPRAHTKRPQVSFPRAQPDLRDDDAFRMMTSRYCSRISC
jgi:hypothetical protein